MLYEVFRPSMPLEPYIEYIWLLVSGAESAESNAEIVLPDGKMELIVHFGDHFSIGDGKHFSRQARCLLAGQITEKIFLKPTGVTGMIAARFKPTGAAKFFDFPMNKIVDEIIDLKDCLGNLAHHLEERILNAASHRDRVNLLEHFLIERLKDSGPDDAFVDQACRYIVQSSGEYNIANLASLVGLSERQVERKFLSKVGVSPKFLSRIIRFQKFLAMAKSNRLLTLTDAALACGYYDQAHFIRDFKAFSGLSPSHYLAQSNVLAEFFTESR